MQEWVPVSRRIIVVLVVGLLALSFYCVFGRSRKPQFELSLSRVLDVRDANSSPEELVPHSFRWPIKDTNDDWVVIIRVRNRSSRELTLGSETVQPKVSGKWEPAKQVAWLNSKYFVATVDGRSDDEFVAAVVPHHTELVRLALDYGYKTLAGKSYDQCGYYWSAAEETRFPKLVRWAASRLRRVLDTPRFRHCTWYAPITYELTLPSSVQRQPRPSEHNLSLHWTGSSRFSLVPIPSSLAAAPVQ